MWTDRALGTSLRLLTRFAGSDLADRLGLHEPTRWLLERGARVGLRTAGAVASRFRPVQQLVRPVRQRDPARAAGLIDLRPTEEQELVRTTARRFADEVLRPAAAAADEAGAPPAGLAGRYRELGVELLAVPEQLGGAGGPRSPITTALIGEELARGDMGLAYALLAPLGVVHALIDGGSAAQQSRYLPAFAGEDPVAAAVAVLEPRPLFDPFRLGTRAEPARGGGYALHGVKSLVPWAHDAELWLVAAELAGAGPALFLVERGAAGLSVEPEPAMGLRAADLGRLRLDGVPVGPDARLGDGIDYAALIAGGRIAWGALAVGTCQAVLDYVIPYCNERHAFGEPITHRQAVAFMIADMALELEALRLLVWRAASRAEGQLDHRREACLVRVQAAAKAMQIGTDGVQLLGGHGFVKDHPVERWYRSVRAVGVMEGGLLA